MGQLEFSDMIQSIFLRIRAQTNQSLDTDETVLSLCSKVVTFCKANAGLIRFDFSKF